MKKILLFGLNGQVGWELSRSLLPVGEVVPLSRASCDLTNTDEIVDAIKSYQPDIIVNAAAYTAVDKAEEEQDLATQINVNAPAVMAEMARQSGALLVDYSTDYVFDGSKQGAYTELDKPTPINVYGKSKSDGLHAIEMFGCRHLIFRVSWVYGSHGNNFVRTMLNLAKRLDEIRVIDDQMGAPTPAPLIADITAHSLLLLANDKGEEGVYNLVPDSHTSWFGFAQQIFECAGKDYAPTLTPIPTSEYPTLAERPANSVMDNSKIKNTFGFVMPTWQAPLNKIVSELLSSQG